MKNKIVYQGHHPSRDMMPNYTIRLRKWVHMFIRRLEQFKPTQKNIEELEAVARAVVWVYHLKKVEYDESLSGEAE